MTKLNRRRFLAGCAGLLASAPLLGRMALAQDANQPRNLIIIFARGGWDVSMALDPKPGNPNVDSAPGDVRLFGDIPILTHPGREEVTRYFSDFGAQTALINGVAVQSIAHPECVKRVLTGTTRETNPDLGAIVGHTTGAGLPVPYFILGNAAFTGPLSGSTGRAGITNQIVALLDPRSSYPTTSPHPAVTPSGDEQALIDRYLGARADALRQGPARRGLNAARVDDYTTSMERAGLLRDFRDAFGARGIQQTLSQQLGLAVEMLSGGVCRAIIAEDPLGWDSHQNNDPIQTRNHRVFFDALAQLAADLERTGLMDHTTVAVFSEMSRTPKRNAEEGKDHWPYTSALLLGAGVRGGRVFGATNDLAEGVPIDFATGLPDPGGELLYAENLIAGLLGLLGVEASDWLPRANPLQAIVA